MSPAILENGLRGVCTNAPAPSVRNNADGGWIVQKFGGTSVGKLPLNIAEDIVRYVAHSSDQDDSNFEFVGRIWKAIGLQLFALLEVQEKRLKVQQVGESQSGIVPIMTFLRV